MKKRNKFKYQLQQPNQLALSQFEHFSSIPAAGYLPHGNISFLGMFFVVNSICLLTVKNEVLPYDNAGSFRVNDFQNVPCDLVVNI